MHRNSHNNMTVYCLLTTNTSIYIPCCSTVTVIDILLYLHPSLNILYTHVHI